ncbi:carbonic anhydrase 4-like [Rhinichthys klamathensis goyatoka]|uniref:carbonic anhydrase 4-like n=1 Tax=Rhinichthys klamathensis goyatoka TaxID=3034132 RepID=UPI0024B63382|nr:carbonic anhydrase 4-like [Rhinichthys klamathensis goyatoka]
MMNAFMACLACLWLMVHTASSSVSWCYNRPSCRDVTWSKIASKACNGTQQSPINIISANVRANANLTPFNFTGYDDKATLTEIINTGKTIKVPLDRKRMHVEGGDLPGLFTSKHFHLHWGNGSAMPGSEHTVDDKRYPMELHIVNKAVHNGSVSGDPEMAVLGVFIEATNDIGKPTSWKYLTSYLKKIANAGDVERISHNISMNDLLPGVDRTKYYRYMGSMTTPNCTEGVVWTIFKDPIKVSKDLIDLFTKTVYINKTTNSSLMTNTFRSIQPINGRIVMSQAAGAKNSGLLKPPTSTSTTKPTTPSTTKPTTPTSTTKPTSTAKTITSTATNPSQALVRPLLSLVLLYCILPLF